jgi:hypothetical protein
MRWSVQLGHELSAAINYLRMYVCMYDMRPVCLLPGVPRASAGGTAINHFI